MKAQNAEKKLAALGAVIKSGNGEYGTLAVHVGAYVLSCTMQNGDVRRFHTRRSDDLPDSQSDYFPGSYWPTLTQALKYGVR